MGSTDEEGRYAIPLGQFEDIELALFAEGNGGQVGFGFEPDERHPRMFVPVDIADAPIERDLFYTVFCD